MSLLSAKESVMDLVERLNKVEENVWAVVIILIGAALAALAVHMHELLQPAGIIVGAGAMAFKGNKGTPQG
jgi:hypothetical protein